MQDVTLPLNEYFRANVRHWRTFRGLTQLQLADRLGITQPSVAAIEAGKGAPSLETVARLAEALQVPAANLLLPPEENLVETT